MEPIKSLEAKIKRRTEENLQKKKKGRTL